MNTPTPQEILDRATEAVSTEAERERVAVDMQRKAVNLCGAVSALFLIMGTPGAPPEFVGRLLDDTIKNLQAASEAANAFTRSRRAEPERAP